MFVEQVRREYRKRQNAVRDAFLFRFGPRFRVAVRELFLHYAALGTGPRALTDRVVGHLQQVVATSWSGDDIKAAELALWIIRCHRALADAWAFELTEVRRVRR